MDNLINTVIGYGITMSPLVMIFVEVIKRPKLIPSDWLPAVACVIGLVLGVWMSFIFPEVGTWAQLSLSGIVAGAVASGIYKQTSIKNDKA